MKTGIFWLMLLFSLQSLFGQSFDLELEYDGELREYILDVPSVYTGEEEVPLLFSLHGLTNTGAINREETKFELIADTANFIVCYPTALLNGFNLTAWNNGLIVGTGADDTGFFLHLIEVIAEDYEIDRERIYFTGFSMGGFMSNRMACEFSDVVAAIASHSGTIPQHIKDDCATDRPFPMMHIHGNSDNIVAYGGNSLGGFVSVDSLMRHWRDHNNCSSTYTITELPDTTDDGRMIDKYVFDGCDNGFELLLYEAHGHNHAWLQPENDIFSSIEIWNFLRRHTLSGELSVGVNDWQKEIRIYPNPVQDQLQIEWNLEERLEALRIFDQFGRLIKESNNSETHIDTKELLPGIYVLELNGKVRRLFTKI